MHGLWSGEKIIMFLSFVILSFAAVVHGFPGGPPPGACDTLSPDPSRHGANPTAGNGGYLIATDIPFNASAGFYMYTAGQAYTVQVLNMNPQTFRGFFVQPRDPDGTRIGTFTTNDNTQQILDCQGQGQGQEHPLGTSIAHSNPGPFRNQSFTWTAPTSDDGFVNFMYTVVQTQPVYFVMQSAVENPLTLDNATAFLAVTSPPTTEMPRPTGLSVASNNTDDYTFTARSPSGCSPSDCRIFVGIVRNIRDPDFIDVYIEGSSQSWVAVGFSGSRSMPDADVLGCNVDPGNNMVEVLDTYNPGSRTNINDATNDVIPFSSSFTNGRITCVFARKIVGSDGPPQDFDLDDSFFILFGSGPANPIAGRLGMHPMGSGNPLISDSTANPVRDEVDIGADIDEDRIRLTRAHGILMIIAWPVLAVTAIFFAAWMRPALPNGQWFQIHRAFMLASLFIGAVGFMLIFVAQRNRPDPGLIDLGSDNPEGTAHFIIGIIVMALHIANPIISIFRCHPGTPNRWIFNLLHGTCIGILAELLALVNVGIGVAIFSENFSRFQPDLTILHVYIAYIAFFVVVIASLFIIFTFVSLNSDDTDRAKLAPSPIKPFIKSGDNASSASKGVELTAPGQKPSEPDAEKPKTPSQDAPVRWVSLGVFLVVIVSICLALIIMIAIE